MNVCWDQTIFPGLYSKQNYFQGDKIVYLFIHFWFLLSWEKTNLSVCGVLIIISEYSAAACTHSHLHGSFFRAGYHHYPAPTFSEGYGTQSNIMSERLGVLCTHFFGPLYHYLSILVLKQFLVSYCDLLYSVNVSQL